MIANVRYSAIGLLQTAGVAGIVAYAAGADDYYAPDGVSRWEHATRDGGAAFLVTIIAIAAAISFAFLAQGLFLRRPRFGVLVIPAVAVYCALLLFAYALLSLGH
jgi:hypothetical protein